MRAPIVGAVLWALVSSAQAADPPGARELRGTELIVQETLDAMEAPEAEISVQQMDSLAATFPDYLFVLATFLNVDPSELPEPLTARNLFAVSPDGEARHLATPEDLLTLFEEASDPVKTADDARKAAEAALALEAAKFPEQPFAPPELQATPDGDGGFNVSGAQQPEKSKRGRPSGTGPISVNLSIPSSGRPGKIVTNNQFLPPARRRRPVTADDIAADTPAAQQAAGGGPITNINSPTINSKLPGSTFFKSPGGGAAGSGKNKPKGGGGKAGVVAVDPSGQAKSLNTATGLARYVRQQYGKVTNAKDAKEIMETYLTLATGNFPKGNFAPVDDSDIAVTKNSDGGLKVTGKVHLKGDESKFFRATWNYNANGKFIGGSHGNKGLNKLR